MRIAGIVENSFVDGPGLRFTVFTQGCKHSCAGCHNQMTHDFGGGYEIKINDIAELLSRSEKYLDGFTLSGGDPFEQIEDCIELLKAIKDRVKNIWCYTGYTYEEIVKDSKKKELLRYVDVLVDGEFKIERKSMNLMFRGSSNQCVVDVKESIKQGTKVLVEEYK